MLSSVFAKSCSFFSLVPKSLCELLSCGRAAARSRDLDKKPTSSTHTKCSLCPLTRVRARLPTLSVCFVAAPQKTALPFFVWVSSPPPPKVLVGNARARAIAPFHARCHALEPPTPTHGARAAALSSGGGARPPACARAPRPTPARERRIQHCTCKDLSPTLPTRMHAIMRALPASPTSLSAACVRMCCAARRTHSGSA